ncbi:hypothetical protein A0H81_03076, partial [Grifola frondosa]
YTTVYARNSGGVMSQEESSDVSLKYVYCGLLTLRAFFALFGTGYIHPDEYFQNGEVTAGQILGLHTLRTWEWNPAFPCRSIIPPWLTTGLPFMFAQCALGGE